MVRPDASELVPPGFPPVGAEPGPRGSIALIGASAGVPGRRGRAPVAFDAACTEAIAAFSEQLAASLQHDLLALMLLDAGKHEFERFVAGPVPSRFVERRFVPLEQTYLAQLLRSPSGCIHGNLSDHRAALVGTEELNLLRHGLHSMLAVPLRIGGEPIGVMALFHSSRCFYKGADVALAQWIAEQVASFLPPLRGCGPLAPASDQWEDRGAHTLGDRLSEIGGNSIARLDALAAGSDAYHEPCEQPSPTSSEEPSQPPIRVLVATRPVVREGIASILAREEDIRVVATASVPHEILAAVTLVRPDVLVMDPAIGQNGNPGTVERVSSLSPEVGILLFADASDFPRAMASAVASVTGILTTSAESPTLVHAIRATADGTSVLDRSLRRAWHRRASVRSLLSDRERQVLELLADGRTNEGIAREIFVGTKTVERTVATIVRKLKARNRVHAVARAVEYGLVKHHSAA